MCSENEGKSPGRSTDGRLQEAVKIAGAGPGERAQVWWAWRESGVRLAEGIEYAQGQVRVNRAITRGPNKPAARAGIIHKEEEEKQFIKRITTGRKDGRSRQE